MPRFVAIHSEVVEELRKWKEGDHVARAQWTARLTSVLRNLKRGGRSVDDAEMALRQLHHKPLKGAEGDVTELGKNCKGGAPRVFLLRRHRGWIFLAAGVEEGSSGAPQIPSAKARSKALCADTLTAVRQRVQKATSTGKPPAALNVLRAWLGSDYEIDVLET